VKSEAFHVIEDCCDLFSIHNCFKFGYIWLFIYYICICKTYQSKNQNR